MPSKRSRCLRPRGVSDAPCFFDFWLHSKQDHHIQSCQHGQVNSGGSQDLGTSFFFPCVLIYCPSGKPSKVLNLVGTLASPCSDLYSVSLLKPLSHSTASLVKISRGHAEIKLETCWLCKWNIKMEFLKVPPPRSSIFEEGGSSSSHFSTGGHKSWQGKDSIRRPNICQANILSNARL